ncbi:MAG: ATP-dependent sacrificial sulfur transferase LarE [Oscillospiraceae bacterium]|nr:ATP-dependent sacrificial sulfur transferase LarE [Oscillospiraceae bacterium]
MTLQDYFAAHPKVALAFSGGGDSAYLLYAGLQAGADVRPYYVKTQFQPDFEYRDAMRLCRELGAEPRVLTLDALADPLVRRNGSDRCYHCKTNIMSTIIRAAAADGFALLLDGTNASDDGADRPGMRALTELGIQSPLRLCGLTKPEIRRLSREAGLFTWNKPAYACLATRVRTGEELSGERLARIERSEDALSVLGFTDFRVRTMGRDALLQFTGEQLPRARAEWEQITARLAGDFAEIRLDPKERESSV